MDASNSNSAPQKDNQDDSEPAPEHLSDASSENSQPMPDAHSVAGKILLTSRRTKKHVTIHEESSSMAEASNVEESIIKLETNFANGVEDVRQSVKALVSEKAAFQIHIKSLEAFIRKFGEEKEGYKSLINQMKNDIEILTAKLEAAKKQNDDLLKENSSVKSEHQEYMESIADQHRRRWVEKKAFRKWKGKLTHSSGTQTQMAELIEENEKLKRELLQYQESAKHAFLRSANALNSEALSLFQETATRRLNVQTSDTPSPEDSFEDSKSEISHSDHGSDLLGHDEPDLHSKDKENDKYRYSRERRGVPKESTREGMKRNIEYVSDDSRTSERKRNLKEPLSRHPEAASFRSFSKYDSRLRDPAGVFIPDPLRQETRKIMRNLDTSKRSNTESCSDKSKRSSCQSKTHVHICHCTPVQGKPGNCPYCFAHQNYNFANMPFAPKEKSKSRVHFDGREKSRNSSYESVSGEKPKVIYKPSGSTVVIEKHL